MSDAGMNRHAQGPSLHCLLVEGSPAARQILQRVVQEGLAQSVDIRWMAAPPAGQSGESGGQESGMRPELALVDLDHDALAACRLMQALPPDCLKIATTLYEDEERLLPAMRSGIHGFLLKQESVEQQLEAFQRIVRGRPPLSPALARALMQAELSARRTANSAEETQLLELIAKGLSLKELARTLKTTPQTVEGRIARIYRMATISTPSRSL